VPELTLARCRTRTIVVTADERFDLLTPLGTRPRLWVRDGLLTETECVELVEAGRDPAALGAEPSRHGPTGRSFEWPVDAHPLTLALRARLDGLIGETTRVGSTLRFRDYAPGEGHPAHIDNYRIDDNDLVATAIVSLTRCDAGGSTTFGRGAPAVSVQPRPGRLVLWSNCLHDGSVDVLAHHAGDPVVAGRKVTLTSFVYRDPHASTFVAGGPIGEGR
jgi:prolyl 4-hydroxylase